MHYLQKAWFVQVGSTLLLYTITMKTMILHCNKLCETITIGRQHLWALRQVVRIYHYKERFQRACCILSIIPLYTSFHMLADDLYIIFYSANLLNNVISSNKYLSFVFILFFLTSYHLM